MNQMALVVKRKGLSRKDEEFIAKTLLIKPVEKLPPHLKHIEKEPFPFYVADKDKVRVPLAFGLTLLEGKEEDLFYPEINVCFRGKLRERQKRKVRKLNICFEEYRTATLCAHTGFGKTIIANYYISKHGLKTVILVPSTILMEQWPKAINEVLDAKVCVVGEDYVEDPDIYICMPDRWDKIKERDKIGFLIVDEAHMFCTRKRSIPLLQFTPMYILALTASPQRRDGTIGILHSLCGLHRVTARYLNPVTVWCFKTGIIFDTVKDRRKQTNWPATLKNVIECDERNELIADLTHVLVNEGKKPLLMCERKNHVEDLTERLKEKGISVDFLMENKNLYQDSQVLIAIMKKAGTGFDEQYACPEFGGERIDTVVYCSSFKEINALIQYGGRSFRCESPLLIHLVDRNSIIENHWRLSKKYYQSGEYLKNVNIKTVYPKDIWE